MHYSKICKSHMPSQTSVQNCLRCFRSRQDQASSFCSRNALNRFDTTYLSVIDLFGFLVTLALFIYELRGVQHCKVLNHLASRLEQQLHLRDAQFTTRPKARLGGFVGARGAAYIIYPTMLAAWVFVVFVGFKSRAQTSPATVRAAQTPEKQ
jgi:hypothetical protein